MVGERKGERVSGREGGREVWWETEARNGIALALQLSNLRTTMTQWPDNKVEDGRGRRGGREARERREGGRRERGGKEAREREEGRATG